MNILPWGTDVELTENQFYNRSNDISFLKSLLETTSQGSAPSLMITGRRGVGKTVLLKKLKQLLDDEYFVCYFDLSQCIDYKNGKITEFAIFEKLFKTIIKESNKKGFLSIDKKINKFLKTNDFELQGLDEFMGVPIPIFSSSENYVKLMEYVLDLFQVIYEEQDIKGSIVIFDEFQVLRDLDSRLNNFLWYIRSVVQSQKNVAYVFSGSLSIQDDLIDKIAGKKGAFGGRILSFDIQPFSKETTQSYLETKVPELKFNEDGFNRFYKCTQGIPFYINTFANFLPHNTELDDENIKINFNSALPFLAIHLSNQWSRLTFQEQKIIVAILEGNLRRKDIANELNVESGSLSNSLNNLIKLGLIVSNNGTYEIIESIFKAWLKREFDNNGFYPFRM